MPRQPYSKHSIPIDEQFRHHPGGGRLQGRDRTMLDALRKFNKDNADLDEMMSLSAFGKTLQAEYLTHAVPVPDWLTSTMTTLGHEISSKTKDQLEKRRRELLAQQSGLETAEVKRTRIAKELAEIDAKLGVGVAQ